MGLKGDIEEVKSAWSKSPWWVRGWLSLSAYLAVSSIASLAETVVKWKGFIQDSINFYRTWINLPLRHVLRIHFDLNISENVTDIVLIQIVCIVILYIAFKRIIESCRNMLKSMLDACESPEEKDNILKLATPFMLSDLFGILLLSMYIGNIFSFVRFHNNKSDMSFGFLLLQVAIVLLTPIIPPLISNIKYRDLSIKHILKQYYTPIILIFLIVGLLAAINKGFVIK